MKPICVAVLLSALAAGCSQKTEVDAKIEDLHKQAMHEASAAPAKELASVAANLGETVRVESLDVTPQSVELKNVSGVTADGRSFTNEGPYLVLTLFIKNVGDSAITPTASLVISDESGFESEPKDSVTIEGQPLDALPPGKQRILVVCAEPPNPRAKNFALATTIVAKPNDVDARRKVVVNYQTPEAGTATDAAAPADATPPGK